MTVTVVVHLVPEALAEGRLVGLAELAGTGQRAAIRGVEDLVVLAGGRPTPTPPEPEELP